MTGTAGLPETREGASGDAMAVRKHKEACMGFQAALKDVLAKTEKATGGLDSRTFFTPGAFRAWADS